MGFFISFFTAISLTSEVLTVSLVSGCLEMPVRKMRVEVYDDAGDRYTITFDGRVTRDKAIRLLDLVELLGGMPGFGPELARQNPELSKVDKVRLIVEKRFPVTWFSSKDVQAQYEQEFKEPIGLSTVSTYLSRLADRQVLIKSRASNRRRYKIATEIARLARASL